MFVRYVLRLSLFFLLSAVCAAPAAAEDQPATVEGSLGSALSQFQQLRGRTFGVRARSFRGVSPIRLSVTTDDGSEVQLELT